jgi:glycosyltransferase involved in cell wall biosynthesis
MEPRVLCLTLSREQELPTVRSLRQSGINCTTVSQEKKKYTEQQIRWLLEQLAEDPPDVFVSNMVIPAAYYAGRWLRKAGIATVGICHGGGMYDFYPGLLDEFVVGKAGYRVSAFVCVSKYLQGELLRRDPEKILVRRIPCGISIGHNLVKKPNGVLRLVYMGQLVEERKRILELTQALCRVVREIPATEALICGDGPDRPSVERLLAEEGSGLPVHLVGFVEHDQVERYLLDCHAVVLLSDHEGLGLALLEGMACGLVPIALRGAPGVTEFVRDDVTGLLVDDRGDDFVAAVRRLRQDSALWERLSRSARTQAKAEYSDEICVARWQELFHNLVNSSGPRKPLRIPRRLRLPPIHPALAAMDLRLPRFHQRLVTRLRSVASVLSHN